jgi:hypothetical protein
MAQPIPQNYANHVRKLPPLYLAASAIVVLNTLWSLYGVVRFFSVTTVMHVLSWMAVLVLFVFSRTFALTVQDRVIRLEERLRMERLLPADLHARIGDLTIKQVVALRFASDAELPALARDVLDGKLTEPDTIKRQIREWRADWLRA